MVGLAVEAEPIQKCEGKGIGLSAGTAVLDKQGPSGVSRAAIGVVDSSKLQQANWSSHAPPPNRIHGSRLVKVDPFASSRSGSPNVAAMLK